MGAAVIPKHDTISTACSVCGKRFETVYASKKYCSIGCKIKANNERDQRRRANHGKEPVCTKQIDSYLAPAVSVRDLI